MGRFYWALPMNRNFILFNVLPLVVGWIGIKQGYEWLVILATATIVIRSVLSLIVSTKLHFSFSELSQAGLQSYRAVLSNPQLTFSAAIINMISLVVWGQAETLPIVAVATGVYFSVRSQLLRHT